MAKEKCDRNCATCAQENRSFCAVQMAMANQELLVNLSKQIEELKTMNKHNEALIAPYLDTTEPTALGTEEE